MSQLSTVPNSTSPRSARRRTPGTLSSIQRILLPEKYASISSPVAERMRSSSPRRFRSSHSSAVRRHCHTMALYTGSPVALSHRMVVSRWLVTPMPATLPVGSPATASAAARRCVSHISMGSCSTQPDWGKCWGRGCWPRAAIWPCRSKTMARELVVP